MRDLLAKLQYMGRVQHLSCWLCFTNSVPQMTPTLTVVQVRKHREAAVVFHRRCGFAPHPQPLLSQKQVFLIVLCEWRFCWLLNCVVPVGVGLVLQCMFCCQALTPRAVPEFKLWPCTCGFVNCHAVLNDCFCSGAFPAINCGSLRGGAG